MIYNGWYTKSTKPNQTKPNQAKPNQTKLIFKNSMKIPKTIQRFNWQFSK